jgi:hypothetical protein
MKTYLSGFRKTGKIIHFEKLGPIFPSRPQRGRVLPEFGWTQLSTKKVANKIFMRQEGGGPKKIGHFLFPFLTLMVWVGQRGIRGAVRTPVPLL